MINHTICWKNSPIFFTEYSSLCKSITFPTKVYIVKATVFPVVMHRCESWIIKKAEHQGFDPFELWCWRRLLRVPWTAGSSNQSLLKDINLNMHWKDWCWNWSSNTLATFWEETDPLKMTLMLWKIEGRRRRGQRRMRWLLGITDSTDMSLSKLGRQWSTGTPGMLQFMGSQTVGYN